MMIAVAGATIIFMGSQHETKNSRKAGGRQIAEW
jgi:hypothetical protein